MPYFFHAFPFCTRRMTVSSSASESQSCLGCLLWESLTNAREPCASPLLKGSNTTNTKVTYRQVQSSNRERTLRKQSCRTILSWARQPQQGQGQAGEVKALSHVWPPEPTPAHRGVFLNGLQRRTSHSHHPGWNSGKEMACDRQRQVLGTGYASISLQSTHWLSVQ